MAFGAVAVERRRPRRATVALLLAASLAAAVALSAPPAAAMVALAIPAWAGAVLLSGVLFRHDGPWKDGCDHWADWACRCRPHRSLPDWQRLDGNAAQHGVRVVFGSYPMLLVLLHAPPLLCLAAASFPTGDAQLALALAALLLAMASLSLLTTTLADPTIRWIAVAVASSTVFFCAERMNMRETRVVPSDDRDARDGMKVSGTAAFVSCRSTRSAA